MQDNICIDYKVTNREDKSSSAANGGIVTAPVVGSKGANKES